MIKRLPTTSAILLLTFLLASCNEQHNPLLGQWQQISGSTEKPGKIIEFTPSTMRVKGRTVTVAYQIRPDKVRVSASKKAVIYTFVNTNEIHFEDEKWGTVRLMRIIR